MGTEDAEVKEEPPYPYSFEVHNSMCTELMRLVDRIVKVFPDIEAARPRCSSGLQALCMLNNAIERAKQHLQHCSDSSKLYLAITGDVIVMRCQRSRTLLEQSLGEVKNVVPVVLAVQISRIMNDLQRAVFKLDPSEEEAGKAVRELLQQRPYESDSVENSEAKALQFAASRLHITSPLAILIEKRCIKKLRSKFGGKDHAKRKILDYLLYLLRKYGNLIKEEQTEGAIARNGRSFEITASSNGSVYGQSVDKASRIGSELYEAGANIISGATPETFRCPISMRIMYDPVIIASGQTFERMWVEKWFDEGNDTCPKTRVKLSHRSLTPNAAIKDQISKWCKKHGITVPDPRMPTLLPSDISSSSIASFGSSMNDLQLPMDISNVSLSSTDSSYCSDTPITKARERSSLVTMQTTDDSIRCQSYANIHETDLKILSEVSELPWESQCTLVEDLRVQLQYNEQVYDSLSSENFSKPLISFLKDAYAQHDERAMRGGLQLLLASLSGNRSEMPSLHEDTFSFLPSLLDSEVMKEALCIFELLSGDAQYRLEIVADGALAAIMKILNSEVHESREQAVRILHNLSWNKDICSRIVSLECIPQLVPFINDSNMARYCISLLKNLCDTEEARVSVAETRGCLASITELLESGSSEEQEHAVAVLLSLCSQHIQYCRLVMDEGVIPYLVGISVNGNDKGKSIALELLRQLRDATCGEEQESSFSSDLVSGGHVSNHSTENKPTSKKSGIFKLFSRRSHHVSGKRR